MPFKVSKEVVLDGKVVIGFYTSTVTAKDPQEAKYLAEHKGPTGWQVELSAPNTKEQFDEFRLAGRIRLSSDAKVDPVIQVDLSSQAKDWEIERLTKDLHQLQTFYKVTLEQRDRAWDEIDTLHEELEKVRDAIRASTLVDVANYIEDAIEGELSRREILSGVIHMLNSVGKNA